MGKILIVDPDLKQLKTIRSILESRAGQKVSFFSERSDEDLALSLGSPDNHTLFYARDQEAALKVLNENNMNIMFMADRIMNDEALVWVERFKGLLTIKENKSLSIAILSAESDPTFVRKFINTGISDLICMPIDTPLFIQKFDLLLTKKVNSQTKELYELKVSRTIDVAQVMEIEHISEFGVSICSARPISVDECVVFYSEAFAEAAKGEVVGRCYATYPHANKKGHFQASFVYLGVSDVTLKNIRRFLRQQYAQKKQAP